MLPGPTRKLLPLHFIREITAAINYNSGPCIDVTTTSPEADFGAEILYIILLQHLYFIFLTYLGPYFIVYLYLCTFDLDLIVLLYIFGFVTL